MNVDVNLVTICFAVAGVAVGVTIWLMTTYQTKTEARSIEDRTAKEFSEIHNGMVQVWDKINEIQGGMAGVAKDVAYIRGRLEPKD